MTRIHPTTEMAVDAAEDGPAPEPSKKDRGFQEVTFAPPLYDDEDEDAPVELYEPSMCEKILNYMLCRTDLATQKLAMRPVSLMELFRFANKTDWLLIFFGMICASCAGVGQPVLALIAGRISNVLMVYPPRSHQFKNKAYENVYIFLGVGVFCLFVNFFQYYFFQTVCNRIITRLKYNYVASIIRQNAGWFDKNHSGALTTTLNDNIDRIREGIGEKLGLLVRGFAMLVAAIVISFIYEWRLSLLMLGVTPTTCIVMSFLSQKMGSTTMKELADVGKAGAIAEESVLGVRTVQACNGQEEMVERYAAELAKGKKFGVQKGYWSGFLGGLFFFVLFAFLGCGVLYGAYLLKVGIFTNPGDVFICIMAMLLGAYFLGLVSPHLMVLLNARVAAAVIYATIDRVPKIDVYSEKGERPPNPIGRICIMAMLLGAYFLGLVSPHLMVLLNARVAAAVIYATIDRVPKIDVYSEKGDSPPNPIGRVEFKNVHFRYPTRKNAKILNGLNLAIEPGQTVALVGHSGCGKSTTVGLLTRLYEPEAGSVTIDGVDVRKFNISYLRHVCGIVQQEPVLFNATIAENLKIGFPECTRERMVEVCKMANAHGFIQTLPNGYDTLIGDGGVQLSGGQKQRIAIARTLARDPKVLLLDEATSALDAQSESVVQSALDNAAK
uniref:Uncharacterized protein n=1 Tax=Panagrolaimus sp. JU765 TaxID=591449 RepID=A0AC34QTH7_9BILA